MLFSPIRPHAESDWRLASKFTALFAWSLRVSDLGVLVGAGLLAHYLRFDTFTMPIEYVRGLARGVLFALIVLNGSSLYRSWRGGSLTREGFKLVTLWSLVFAAGVVYMVGLQLAEEFSRLWWLTWFGLTLAGTLMTRVFIRTLADQLRARGMDHRKAVIVGGGHDARRIAQGFAAQPWTGIEILGWFSTPSSHKYLDEVPLLGEIGDLAAYIETHGIDQVWISLPMSAEADIQAVLGRLAHSAVDIKLVPDLFGLHLLNHGIDQIADLPVVTLQQSPLQGSARLLKGIEDRVLSALILLMIAPLMACIAIAVKLSSPGPVFYRQERVSWNNRRFEMLKFRSMPVDAESGSGAVWAKSGESRATRVGAFLRRTSLDELPQFLNVLKGDMSIVGPRPERPVFVDKFKEEIPAYMKKHLVKAGITGWAQVNGWRGSTDLQRRIECDIYYIENWSLLFDLRIILLTLFKGFIHKNAY
ncbi:undecaprenyl-phosphate glucose phosphotransferase [Luteimonas terrae]|uniref:Undecaprenyl-phosphate glucose phosphotransferase n=1 Tax=Luteimonas terrae TaxID=1530191 RepID=A0A4R5U980_9GAMM|nr:undecaprenyl-phosphate glucose phosphotransferase [Luteimonas terrae]TDK30888.1 undecaprenyl-phosphate glucose phosphotransferase [Luteimonas terrae]